MFDDIGFGEITKWRTKGKEVSFYCNNTISIRLCRFFRKLGTRKLHSGHQFPSCSLWSRQTLYDPQGSWTTSSGQSFCGDEIMRYLTMSVESSS